MRFLEAVSAFRDRHSVLAFAGPEPLPLVVPVEGVEVRAIRFSLRASPLHLHSVSFTGDSNDEIDVGDGDLELSSSSVDVEPSVAWRQLFNPSGGHDFSFHTKKQAKSWAIARFREPVRASRLVVRNRRGAYARRAADLIVEISPDGQAWEILHDGKSEADSFVGAVAIGGESAIGAAAKAASGTAALLLAYRYEEAVSALANADLTVAEEKEIKRAANEVVLSTRELEWTAHGVRRSFRFWGEQEKASYVALSVEVCDCLGAISEDVCLGFGSVLAIIRDRELIKHDDDLDVIIAFPEDRVRTLSAALSLVKGHLEGKGYDVRGKFLSHWHVTKGGKKVDVFVGVYEEGRVGWFPGARAAFRREDVFPARKIEFMGTLCPVPRCPEAYLAATYGPNWKVPIPGWKHDWDRTAYFDIA